MLPEAGHVNINYVDRIVLYLYTILGYIYWDDVFSIALYHIYTPAHTHTHMHIHIYTHIINTHIVYRDGVSLRDDISDQQ